MGIEGGADEETGKNRDDDDGEVDLWGVFETKENKERIESETGKRRNLGIIEKEQVVVVWARGEKR